jgi:peptidoglycan hydrolase CwlO-like protein
MDDFARQSRCRHRCATSAALLALLCAAGLAGGSAAPAKDLHAQLERARSKLGEKRKRQGVLSSTIRRDDARIAELEGQVATLRTQIAVTRERLERVEARLAKDRAHLELLRARLRRALGVLEDRLVAIYESDQPDALSVILDAQGFDDLLSRYDYLKRIEQQDTDLVAAVRRLRDAAREVVRRVRAERDRVAAREAALARYGLERFLADWDELLVREPAVAR